MHGLVSLLPTPYYERVEDLWNELEDTFGLRGIRVTPYPHFSWQIAGEYDFAALEAAIGRITAETPPFNVRTAGLSLFTGPRPVLYIPVVKDEPLLKLHARIWEAALAASQDASPYYSPPAWMPHISLAYEDLTPENIGAVMEALAFRSFAWEMTIDNIALIYEPDGETGALKFKHIFSGEAE
jgi:2'-5' RNA ligase